VPSYGAFDHLGGTVYERFKEPGNCRGRECVAAAGLLGVLQP